MSKVHEAKIKIKQHPLFNKAIDKAFASADFDNSGTIQGAELYAAILLVYMKINKICPVHVKPPKKNEVKKIMKKHDLSEDGQLNKEEFTSVVDDIVAGSSNSFHKTIWFRVASSVALKLAIFPSAAHGLQKGLSAAGFEAINKVPTAVLAMSCEMVYKLGMMLVPDKDE